MQEHRLVIDMNAVIEKIINTPPQDKHVWGPLAWKALETVCVSIPCKECSDHCTRMIRFEHDLVNVHLGKPVHDSDNARKYLGTIAAHTDELLK